MKRTLSPCQERALLYKHTTGEFPGQFWATIEVLFKQGMIAEQDTINGKRILLTFKGKQYCDEHHMAM